MPVQKFITWVAGEDEVFKHCGEGTLSPLDLGPSLKAVTLSNKTGSLCFPTNSAVPQLVES